MLAPDPIISVLAQVTGDVGLRLAYNIQRRSLARSEKLPERRNITGAYYGEIRC